MHRYRQELDIRKKLRIFVSQNNIKNIYCKYKSRKGIYEYRGKIPKAKSIHLRSQVVKTKERIGNFEADTIIGKNHKEAIVTLVDRHSKFTLMQKVASKEAFDVSRAILQLLQPIKNIVKTITSDNGKEFAYHQEILNHRPRKVLEYKTPYEVFFGKIVQWINDSKLHYKNQIVALGC